MPSLDWVNGSVADPIKKGILLTKTDGSTVKLKYNDCFQFGPKKQIVRYTGSSFSGRLPALFTRFDYASPPTDISYITAKNLNGKPPFNSGNITLKNTKLLDSIVKIKCPPEVPKGWARGGTRRKRRSPIV